MSYKMMEQSTCLSRCNTTTIQYGEVQSINYPWQQEAANCNTATGQRTTLNVQNGSWTTSMGFTITSGHGLCAVKELSRALQQPDSEDLKNLKQLLRYITGTIHYKVTLPPKVVHNEKGEIMVHIDSLTVTGQVAILLESTQVEQSLRVGDHPCFT
eukprot:2520618-Amphidinium_carterae.1